MRRVAVMSAVALSGTLAGGLSAQQRVALPGEDRPLRDRPAPVWSVGSAEGETWELLSNVRAAVFDGEDNLYALDSGNQRVLVFDRQGTFVRSIGKQGGGPGEFQFPMGLTISADGKLVVGEGRGFSVFSLAGAFERLIPTGSGFAGLRFDEFVAHPDGGVVVRRRNLPQPGGQTVEGARIPAPIVRQPLAENVEPDTLVGLTEPAPTVREMPAQGGRTMRIMTMSPPPTFSRSVQWTALADGRVVVADEVPGWEVKLWDQGRATHVLARPLQPRQATERDRDRARERQRETLQSGGNQVRVSGSGGATFSFGGGSNMTEEQIEQMLENMEFAERIWVVQDVYGDALGRLWVKRAPAVWGDPSPVDLIGSDSRYIGTVPGIELPLATSASGLAVWVEKDELEVERIVVRRLPASWR